MGFPSSPRSVYDPAPISMALSVFDLLTADRINLFLASQSQDEAISATTALLAPCPHVLDLPGFERDILAREQVTSTAVGNGVAFPHARTDCVGQIVMSAGRSREGIAFKNGEERVHFVFIIGTPKNMVREYLSLVGDLVRRVKQVTVREELIRAETVAEFLAGLRGGR